jgi:hypothetical protein
MAKAARTGTIAEPPTIMPMRAPLGKEDEALKEPASVQQPLAKPRRIYHEYMTCSKIQ